MDEVKTVSVAVHMAILILASEFAGVGRYD
jgi:hypothetical protein